MKLKKKEYLKSLEKLEDGFAISFLSGPLKKEGVSHVHHYCEAYFLVCGNMLFQTSSGLHTLMPGDLLLHDEFAMHRPTVLEKDKPYERICLSIDKTLLESLGAGRVDLTQCFQNHGTLILRLPHHLQSSVRMILGKLLSVVQDKPFGYDLLVGCYLVELFVLIVEQVTTKESILLGEEVHANYFLAMVDQFIDENMDSEIQVEDIARCVCMSKGSFMRNFKSLTNLSVYQYLINKRLNAVEEAVTAGKSITSAVQSCGFSDYSCFYRLFFKKHQMSPKRYFGHCPLEASSE